MLLAREFGWTLDAMRQMKPSELFAILSELQRQVAIEKYNEQRNHWAFLAAVIANGFSRIAGMLSKKKPKMVGPDDFMGKDAKKMLQQLLKQDNSGEKNWSKHIGDAKAKGLRGPWS